MLNCQRGRELEAAVFRRDPAVATCLGALNTTWQERLRLFRARVGPPWWAPGLVLTPELRAGYETYLPVAEFAADLARLGDRLLPHPSWVPHLLRARDGGACPLPRPDGPASLPDLWALLPEALAGHLCFAADALPALFCALADPAHFGTAAERYPAQQERFAALCTPHPRGRLRLLDLACGVGLGTFASAALAGGRSGCCVDTVGLTLEPLEAWMAAQQSLPHDRPRQRRLQDLAAGVSGVHFAAADVRRLPVQGPFDIILCNGLIGGTLLHHGRDLLELLAGCGGALAPAGWLLIANRFHDGRRTHVERFAELARERRWEVAGDWHDLALRRR
jgi:SAM-dependent methyltransferase